MQTLLQLNEKKNQTTLSYRNKAPCDVFMGKAGSSDPFVAMSCLAPGPPYTEIQTWQRFAQAVLGCEEPGIFIYCIGEKKVSC